MRFSVLVSGHPLIFAVQSGNRRAWWRLRGHVTLRAASPQYSRERGAWQSGWKPLLVCPEAARLAPLAKFLRQTTKQHAEGVSHISPGQAPKGATLPRVTGVGQPVPWANVSFPTVAGDPVVQSMGSCLMSRESSSQRRRQFVPSVSGVPWNRPISIGLLSFQRLAPHSGPQELGGAICVEGLDGCLPLRIVVRVCVIVQAVTTS